jgi:hypothetical protein
MAGSGGKVLPAQAEPDCYSLRAIAEATAIYNTAVSAGIAAPRQPNVPFTIVTGASVTARPGALLYVPVFFADDSGGAVAGFPKDVDNQRADERFLLNYAFAQYGVEAFIIQVDGKTTVLSADYIVGTRTPPLPDGTPAGRNYIVAGAFLTPLNPGTHTVSIGGLIDGVPTAFVSTTVKVR